MLEMLINPKKAEKRPWELFFVGAFYATISILLVNWIFSQDAVLAKHGGILIVTFTVMLSIPFVYYTIRNEEEKITARSGSMGLIIEHQKALIALMWLFIGFLVAFSFWYMVLPTTQSFQAQIETYCMINQPGSVENCVNQYSVTDSASPTGAFSSGERFFLIFTNNIYVLFFTLLFSLIFGAGVIFILAWNATVIAAAIGIFTDSSVTGIPLGLFRFMLHGIPEIAAYFIVAIAGGIVSFAVIKHEMGTPKFWEVLHDSINLIILAVVVLFVAALMEVFLTPMFF